MESRRPLMLIVCGRAEMALGMVVCFILFSGFFNAASCGASPSARLELPVGFNRSVRDSYMMSTTSNSTLATAAYNNGVFIPFLSSERFNTTSDTGPGFSLGFLFNNISDYSVDHAGAAAMTDIYLSVCVGRRSGSAKQLGQQGFQYLVGKDDKGYYDSNWAALEAGGGHAVPVWVANTGRPLRSVNASLLVVSGGGGGGGELQLRDYNGSVVWAVSTASAMEMQDDTGDLVIYSSNGTTVWQSSQQAGLRALATGQAFTAAMELASDDSLYTLRMLPGGLVFYLNKRFVQQPTPYWIIPFTSPSPNSHTLINSARNPSFPSSLNCSNDPISMALVGPPNSTNISYQFTERCSKASQKLAAISFPEATDAGSSAWFFSKLEDDGRLYVYTVFDNTSDLVKGDGLDSGSLHADDKSLLNLTPSKLPRFYWGACDIPMACGPLGLCASPSGSSQPSANCTCPPENFSFINSTDPSQGCTRIQHSLEDYCKSSEATGLSVGFLELLNTSTILIFGAGWHSNPGMSTSVEECKSECESNCSCSGVFYVVDSSSCFQMTDEISLLTVSNKSFLYFNSSQPTTGISSYNISANNYITYLKVITENPAKKKKQGIGALLLFKLLVALGVALVLFVVLVQLLHWIARLRRRRRQIMAQRSSRNLQEKEEQQELQDLLPMLPTRFSFEELQNATQSFSKLLGAGGCGSVYAGVLPDGRKVAVKNMDSLLRTQSKQFLAEVASIGRTSHHHIVRLVGFCWEHSNRLLVYEYMERGSLDQWIFQLGPKSDEGPLLDWPTRYNIALGIARGLTYLHEECSEPILHFDIKPQNILLDDAFVAKLADFGMSRLIQRDISQVITGVRGTPGYIAPEWLSHGAVSKKCDVYSMGMVMLEIIGGRKNSKFHLRNSENDYADECHFPTLAAKKCEEGMTTQVVDKRLQGAFDEKQAQILIMSALWCIQEDPSLRPFAHTVVQWLEGSSDVKRPPFSVVVPVQFRSILSSSQSYTPSIHHSTPGLGYQG